MNTTDEKYDTSNLIEKLRPLTHAHPTHELWQEIVTLLGDSSSFKNHAARVRALTYATGALNHWPDLLRTIPEHWQGFITNKKQKRPNPALALCRVIYLEHEWLEPEHTRIHRALSHEVFDLLRIAVAVHKNLRDSHFRTLLQLPWISSLRHLNLSGNILHDTSIDHLLQSAELDQLESLNLSNNRFSHAALTKFASHNYLTGLRTLNLSVTWGHNAFDSASIETFAHSTCSPHLQTLAVAGHERIAGEGLMALLNAPQRSALSTLDVSGCGIETHALKPITHTQGPTLSSLNLRYNNLGQAQIIPWDTLAWMRSLRELNLAYNPLGDANIKHLLTCEHLDELEILYLYNVNLSASTLLHVLQARLPSLKKLYMGETEENVFSQRWLERFCDSTLYEQLDEVELVGIEHDPGLHSFAMRTMFHKLSMFKNTR